VNNADEAVDNRERRQLLLMLDRLRQFEAGSLLIAKVIATSKGYWMPLRSRRIPGVTSFGRTGESWRFRTPCRWNGWSQSQTRLIPRSKLPLDGCSTLFRAVCSYWD